MVRLSRRGGRLDPDAFGDRDSEVVVDVIELLDLLLPDVHVVALAELEPIGGDDVLALQSAMLFQNSVAWL